MTSHAAEARLKELEHEVARRVLDGTATNKFMEGVEREAERLGIQVRNSKAALKLAGSASPSEHGITGNPGEYDGGHYGKWILGMPLKSFGAPQAPVVAPMSPMELDGHQLEALRQAAISKAPLSVTVGQKGLEHTFIKDKTAFTEGGLVTNPLPVTQLGGDRGHLGLPFETFRVLSALPSVQMDSPGIGFLRHNSNTNPAAYVAEAGLKPSIQPVIEEVYIRAAKVAATVEATREILTDHTAFGISCLWSSHARS
jgi:hypothetical protein